MINTESSEGFFSKYNLKSKEQSLKKFFTCEYSFLSNNSSLNPDKFRINSRMFTHSIDNYFTFPMILSRSIFRALDTERKNSLSLSDYVEGMLKIYTGTLDERINFIFKILNVNQDIFIHKEDVILLLTYTHIFDNKKNQNLLNNIINGFFGRHSKMTSERFIKRLHKGNSSIFYIIMCILFEHQTFNSNVLALLQEDQKDLLSLKSGGKVKKTSFKNTNCSSASIKSIKLFEIDGLHELMIPNDEVIEYILINYQMDLSFLKQVADDFKEENNSIESDEDLFEEEDEKNMKELEKFEVDVENAKSFLIENAFFLDNYVLPKGGSNDFCVQSGVINSAFVSKIKSSSLSSSRSINPGSLIQKKNTILKSSFAGQFVSTSSLSLVKVASSKDFQSTVVDNQSSYGMNEGLPEDCFYDEILLFKNRTGCTKRYVLTLTKNFILIFKRKVSNILFVELTEPSLILKQFIPLRHLFIAGVEDNTVINKSSYHQLTLISTTKFDHEEYNFLFESKSKLSDFVQMIVTQTKYTSIKTDYTYVKDIGKGTFCTINLMKHNKTNVLYSVKKLKKNVHTCEEFTALNWEKDIINFLKNFPELENIIKFYKIIESIDNIYIIMEYIGSGSLNSYIRRKSRLSSILIKELAVQMFNGVKKLHKYGIIHRDLKLENILVDCKEQDKIELKIIDFGLSRVVTPFEKVKESYGTLIYCSPEIILNLRYNNKVDVWSLGVILYYLKCAYLPFDIKGREKENTVSNMIIMNSLIFPEDSNREKDSEEDKASNILMKVIRACLCKDIHQRPASDKIFLFLTKNIPLREQEFI